MRIEWGGAGFTLVPEGAVLHEPSGTLLVADVHFGKAAAFRAAGIALPSGTTEENLALLDRVIARTGARHLIIIGDFVHARNGLTASLVDAVARWRDRHVDLPMHLVLGNHDVHAGGLPRSWNIEVVCAWRFGERFRCVHDPAEADQDPADATFTLAGHLHPAVRLVASDGAQCRFRCFWVRPRLLVLPAFGRFTGSALIRPELDDRIFIADGGRSNPDESLLVEVTPYFRREITARFRTGSTS